VALVCVTGPIGAGKSSLVGPLAQRLDARACREDNNANPAYAAAFDDPAQWAFEAELTFVVLSLESWTRARRSRAAAVLERCPADNAEIFGASRFAHGEISSRQHEILERCAGLAPALGAVPDLVVLLGVPANLALERVRLRNEPGEEHYTGQYLHEIGERYVEWGRAWTASPVMTIDTAKEDVRVPGTVDKIATEARSILPGLAASSASSPKRRL